MTIRMSPALTSILSASASWVLCLLDDDENVAGADVNIVSFGLMGFVFTL